MAIVSIDAVAVSGPEWCEPGLVSRAGRYPLAVEAPVMSMVDRLVPGVSTVSRLARYHSLYWAIADHTEAEDLDRDACRRLVRRAEVGMACISKWYDDAAEPGSLAHGVDAFSRLAPAPGAEFTIADTAGSGSYSPRSWGFWSQYNGPSVALGTVAVDHGALRRGRHRCPGSVSEMYAPLIAVASRTTGLNPAVDEFRPLSIQHPEETPDAEPIAALLTATVDGEHDPDAWTGPDATRRATLRILARAGQLHSHAGSWQRAFADAVAYGPAAREDPLLVQEDRTLAWRGVVLRHHSVGAWRRLWARLVSQVFTTEGNATRADLHAWISDHLPGSTVTAFEDDLPAIIDGRGDPLPAEDDLRAGGAGVPTDVAVLLLGARRTATLIGLARAAFLATRRTYLDPSWIEQLRREYARRPLAELGRRLVDDMLAQSRRVALRKLTLNSDGTMTMFSRLHERNGTYHATSPEGAGNIGLRIGQLADLAVQVGLLSNSDDAPVTARGVALLDVA
jgi:hypothetical protein